MSDIVQVIDRMITGRQIARGNCMCADANGNMVAGGSCHDCVTTDADIARLHELRDAITRDKEAHVEYQKALRTGWFRVEGRPVAFDTSLHAERALLALCREVGT